MIPARSHETMTRLLAVLALLAIGPAAALAAQRPVVVQLFTSLGCSDCPPADALLARVSAQDHDVLALDLHVTYWNDASWTDPYSLRSVDQLQNTQTDYCIWTQVGNWIAVKHGPNGDINVGTTQPTATSCTTS